MAGLPTGTVTFLFTDIEGSTRLLERLGTSSYAGLLEEHRRLLRTVFREGEGYELSAQGDGFLVVFRHARNALKAAVAAQLAVSTHAWPNDAIVRVRMGLHTGEPLDSASGYVGLDVHLAARIGAAAHGGQVLLSEATRSLVAHTLPEGWRLRDLGAHRLKDLKQLEKIFQLVHPELPGDFPPLKSLSVLPHNLPVQLTSFIGREREMAEIMRLLTANHLLTLTGTGGCGKTRLALRVAVNLLEEFPDGVWLVELAALSDPTLVPQAVAAALRVPEPRARPLAETLVDYLRLKSPLLVLDNCEHVVDVCAHLVEALLRACPNLRILATSREVLNIAGEAVFQVPSLSLPDAQPVLSTERLMLYEAVRLFVDRAMLAQPGFSLEHQDAPAVTQLVRRLDGIPLAIELAAARVKVLSVEQIAARLDDRFRLLTGGARTALRQHQTLRGAMDWSYDLLSEKERVLLRRLSVFAGGWTVEAAEAVCQGESIETSDIVSLLTQLVHKSLVAVETQAGKAWYRMLETVRQYARDRLAESEETRDVRRRQRDWYLRLAQLADLQLTGQDQEVWLNRLEMEHDNLRAALEWSNAEADGAEAGLRLAGALRWFWFMRGHWSEGRRWLEAALARSSNAPRSALPKAFLGAAALARQQGNHGSVNALCEKGLALSRELGDKERVAWFLLNLGLVALDRGDPGRATALCEDALTLCRELGDKWLIGLALAQLGNIARHQGDNERAAEFYEEGLALSRAAGGKWFIAYALRSVGIVALRQGDYARAAALYKESLVLSREVRNIWVIDHCLDGLAQVASARGRCEQAVRLFGAAEALRKILGSRRLAADQAVLDRCVASTRDALGDAAFLAAWEAGQAMALEGAIKEALAEGS